MQKIAESHWLLACSLAACLLLAGCKPLAVRNKPADAADKDADKKNKKDRWDWVNKLRDDRALEVERHLGGSGIQSALHRELRDALQVRHGLRQCSAAR